MAGKNRMKQCIRPGKHLMDALWWDEHRPDALEKLEREEFNRFLVESMVS
jgi:hypothetical protein